MGYEERQCPSCPDCVEDEMHASFHCQSYILQSERLMYDYGRQVTCLKSQYACAPSLSTTHRIELLNFSQPATMILNGKQSLSYSCMICSELGDAHESD